MRAVHLGEVEPVGCEACYAALRVVVPDVLTGVEGANSAVVLQGLRVAPAASFETTAQHRATNSGMEWSGEFCFGEVLAAYVGFAAHNAPHRHAAYQVVFADEPFVVELSGGDRVTGTAIVIRPAAQHALLAGGVVRLLYVEATSPLAERLVGCLGPEDAASLCADMLRPPTSGGAREWVSQLRGAFGDRYGKLDSRLSAVLKRLERNAWAPSIESCARDAGLSTSRLRTLAREQLGVSLSTWMLWRKLERAGRAVLAGESLAGAAALGGFSDQAHFSRTMRRMFGVTPRAATLHLDSGTEVS